MTHPWPHDTVAVPQRIDGWRVVAAAKLPSGRGADRYLAVVEASNVTNGFVFYAEVLWLPRHGFKPTESQSSGIVTYRAAMELFGAALANELEQM